MGIEQILWILLAGIGIATFYVYYLRRFVGKFVRALAEIDAVGKDAAVSMDDLHLKMTLPLRLALRENGSLKNEVGREKAGDTVRYYIFPEKLTMMKAKYRKENLPLLFLLIVLLAITAVGLILTHFYPKIFEMYGALFES